jgi:hypothetical protein
MLGRIVTHGRRFFKHDFGRSLCIAPEAAPAEDARKEKMGCAAAQAHRPDRAGLQA